MSVLLSNNLKSNHFQELEYNNAYLTPYNWELIDLNYCRHWMGQNWTWSIYASIIYLIIIFTGRWAMKERKKFNLRKRLFLWNLLLASFSIIGFIRTIPEIYYVLLNTGFYRSVCERKDHNSATAFWGWFMTLSKLFELGDTVFIVLRKQPLLFLHWYHHITVLVYTWITYEEYDPSLRWFMTMNFGVHGLMYSYYAIKTLQVRIPRSLAMTITSLQLSQMIVGVFINLYSLQLKSSDPEACPDRSFNSMYIALTMYATYFALFANFFLKSYFTNKNKSNSNNLINNNIKLNGKEHNGIEHYCYNNGHGNGVKNGIKNGNGNLLNGIIQNDIQNEYSNGIQIHKKIN